MNVSLLCRRQRCRMQEPEPFDSEPARSGLTAITGPSPARPPRGADRARGDFMTGFSLQTLGFPEIHGDNRPIKLNSAQGSCAADLSRGGPRRRCTGRHCHAAVARESPRDRPRAIAAHASSHRACARPACFRDRPHQRAVVSGGRTEGRLASVRERLRPRRFRGSLPTLSGRLPRGLLSGRLSRVRRLGVLSPRGAQGAAHAMGWNASCRTRMPPANILPRQLTRDALSSSIR